VKRLVPLALLPLFASTSWAQEARPKEPPPIAPSSAAATPTPSAEAGKLFAETLRAYHAALLARRLGQPDLRREEVSARVAEAEQLVFAGRLDEAIARIVEVVEHPQFDLFSDSDDGRAAVFRLGDALASAGIFEPARAYLKRLVDAKGAWEGGAPGRSSDIWARRAVRRLVDVALESEEYAEVAQDLKSVPAGAPEEARGEIAYLMGRADEAAGKPDVALASYGAVTQRCRFWAQATYLSGLIEVERGHLGEGEKLLCKVADPKRSASTTPVFADEKFFAVRDLARLGLGRIAHEQFRNDNARYYYYLVPNDSNRLAEALYEAATTRYEKKDYEGARQLLDELAGLGVRHRYEDEAWVLSAWVDLARCRYADADKSIVAFLQRFEPVRDAARRILQSEAATQRLLAAVRTGTDAAGAEIGGMTPDAVRAVAVLLRVDPAYDRVLHQRAVLEREVSGLVNATAALGDMQRALATNGGVRPAAEVTSAGGDPAERARAIRDAIAGAERQIADLVGAGAPDTQIAPLRQQLAAIEGRAAQNAAMAPGEGRGGASGADLIDLLRADVARSGELQSRIAAEREALARAETTLARDALHRLDLRLSRLVRRARLGRIETVIGRKRALEVEVEAIRLGYLPADAVDSLDAARYLEDNEEYWPFEGDDWPDEYVGGEVK
jgi:tetratricopeptide (TPR) repeat protein